MATMTSDTNTDPPVMPDWERELIDLFVGIFDGLGLPKSTAMIYGTLYCAEDPMLQDEIAARLQISAGSASQGLKLLQALGAVRRQSPIGQRHSLYTAERSMRQLIGNVLDSQIRPRLRSGGDRLQALAASVPEEETLARHRIQTLQTWHRKVEKGVPLLTGLFGGEKRA